MNLACFMDRSPNPDMGMFRTACLVTQVTMWGTYSRNFETSTQTLQNFQYHFALSGFFPRLSTIRSVNGRYRTKKPGVLANFGDVPRTIPGGAAFFFFLFPAEPCRCADARSLNRFDRGTMAT